MSNIEPDINIGPYKLTEDQCSVLQLALLHYYNIDSSPKNNSNEKNISLILKMIENNVKMKQRNKG